MTSASLHAAVREGVGSRLGTHEFGDDDHLADLGLDSIDLIVIVSGIEADLGVSFPDQDLFREETWTVTNMVKVLCRQASAVRVRGG